jgi:hypothetical protein
MLKPLSSFVLLTTCFVAAVSAYAQTATPIPPTPTVGNDYFQTGHGTFVPEWNPTPFATFSLPTPTFIPAGQGVPAFPMVYDPSTYPSPANPIGLSLNGEHIRVLVWNMAMYAVQMWNYYYHVMDDGAHEAIDAAQGVGLVAVVIVIMTNLYGEFKPRLNAGINDVRARANQWADQAPGWTQTNANNPNNNSNSSGRKTL